MTRLQARGQAICCSVATSDSGGGAGIQADLKSFAACGAFGTTVLVALTAQNTQAVEAIEAVSLPMIASQFAALDQDLRPAAVKTGMLLSPAIVEEVSAELARLSWGPLVVDPVMVSKGGARLLEEAAVAAVRRLLLPLALVLTPNWPEAEVLSGIPVTTEAEALAAGRRLLELGPRYVVVKGGHSPGDPVDLVVEEGRVTRLGGRRIDSRHTHGTGCTFSAAITSYLARGDSAEGAIARAKSYVTRAIQEAPGLGQGHGPLQHFPSGWPELEADGEGPEKD